MNSQLFLTSTIDKGIDAQRTHLDDYAELVVSKFRELEISGDMGGFIASTVRAVAGDADPWEMLYSQDEDSLGYKIGLAFYLMNRAPNLLLKHSFSLYDLDDPEAAKKLTTLLEDIGGRDVKLSQAEVSQLYSKLGEKMIFLAYNSIGVGEII